ncbi:MAG: hypothetical protein EAZ95_06120 [Bacteroidetes bacterium]|nr:MAG: hypothetical protein EAZ95_06120 [Bacteroidota bacterium]
MKLLFDENISYRIINKLKHLFPDSLHISKVGFVGKKDKAIWDFAKTEDYSIVTLDEDFSELSLLYDAPPKIIWIHQNNLTTNELVEILTQNLTTIEAFLQDQDLSCLELFA